MGLQLKSILWILILSSTFVIPSVRAEDMLDPCEMPNDGAMVMICQCNGNDFSPTTEVQCYVNSDMSMSTESRPEWAALATLTETIYFEFIMRQRYLKEFPPPILFQKMQKLRVFYVKTSGITFLPPFAFQNSSSIIEVNLKDNVIKELGPFAFSNMENVTQINLDSNEIRSIERSVFVNLPSLKQLVLSANSIEVIHDQAFKHLEHLEELELQKNNLTFLNPEVFLGLKSLARLDLMKNTIQFLGNNVFIQMPNLLDLDLTENKIISVSPTAFHGLKKLGRLNLKGNKIVEFQPGTFAHLSNIYFLDVRENELETFSKELVSDIYSNLLNESMQLIMKDNRFKCDCRILWMHKLWNETKSQILQYYLNQTMCDVPHNFALALDETDLDVRLNGDRSFPNVTLISGPIEETTTSTTGSSIRVTAFTGEGLRCGLDSRKNRQRSGQKRVKVKSGSHPPHHQEHEKEVMSVPEKTVPSSSGTAPADSVSGNPGSLGSLPPPASSANWLSPSLLATFCLVILFIAITPILC